MRNIAGIGGGVPTRQRKDSDTVNDRENGLRMKNETTMKEQRFSFFAEPQERKAKSLPALHTLPSRTCLHTNQSLPKSVISNPQNKWRWTTETY